jgi:hypothetical protein
MARITLVLGVALAITTGAATLWAGVPHHRTYNLTLEEEGGNLVAKKSGNEQRYTLSERFRTTWNFHNKTSKAVDLYFLEPDTCHIEFDKFQNGNKCESMTLHIASQDRQALNAYVAVDWDEASCLEPPLCQADIMAKFADGKKFNHVDPDLQIERDYRFMILLLSVGSGASLLVSYIVRLREKIRRLQAPAVPA